MGNLRIPGSFKEIQSLKTVCRNIIKESNKTKIQDFAKQQEGLKVEISKMQLTRWDGFRERRLKVIDKYTLVAKSKHRIKLFITMRYAHQILQKIYATYMLHRGRRMRRLRIQMLNIAMNKRWK